MSPYAVHKKRCIARLHREMEVLEYKLFIYENIALLSL